MVHRFITRAAACLLAAAAAGTAQAAIVSNGSLEDTAGNWTDTSCGYMAVAVGSGAIGGWTVGSGSGPVAWGRSTTCDGHAASDGNYFLDLSGFGANAGAAAINQVITGLVTGDRYDIALDFLGAAPGVLLGGETVSLAAAGSAGGGWTHLRGSFTATAGGMMLVVGNVTPGALLVFVDNVSVTSSTAGPGGGALPEPSAAALSTLALLALGFARRRV